MPSGHYLHRELPVPQHTDQWSIKSWRDCGSVLSPLAAPSSFPWPHVILTCCALLCREAWILSIPILHMILTLWPVPQFGLMGSYMEEWQTATQKWNNRRLLRREQHLHWVGWSDAGADGIFCAAPQINRSWHMEDRRQGVMGDNIPWCALKRSANGETKTRMCEKWTLHFFKVPPLTASYSFYICGRMPRGSLSMILQDSLGMMCDVVAFQCFFTLRSWRGTILFWAEN